MRGIGLYGFPTRLGDGHVRVQFLPYPFDIDPKAGIRGWHVYIFIFPFSTGKQKNNDLKARSGEVGTLPISSKGKKNEIRGRESGIYLYI